MPDDYVRLVWKDSAFMNIALLIRVDFAGVKTGLRYYEYRTFDTRSGSHYVRVMRKDIDVMNLKEL